MELVLLAEGTTVAEATSWGAITISIISAASAAFMAWNQRKKDEKKLEHEAKLKELELHTSQCLEDRDEQRKELEQVQKKLQTTETKLEKCEEKHEESVKNHEESQAEIKKIWEVIGKPEGSENNEGAL